MSVLQGPAMLSGIRYTASARTCRDSFRRPAHPLSNPADWQLVVPDPGAAWVARCSVRPGQINTKSVVLTVTENRISQLQNRLAASSFGQHVFCWGIASSGCLL